MIYTVTFNPAIDYVVRADGLTIGAVNRAASEKMFFGGKGINVSCVLKELGVQSIALGFTAGFTGEAIENGLAGMGVSTDFVRLKNGFSRINVKINSGEETELNGKGPDIDDEAVSRLYEKLDRLQRGDTLVLAGSVPPSMPADIYEQILSHLDGRGVRAVVDAAGGLLLNVLKYKPYLIKPNNFELGGMFGVNLESDADIEKYARKLQEMGAQNVLVSMAGDGSMLIDEQGAVHRFGVCKGEVVNSVGAGDSMLAGFLAGAEKGYDYALKLATACGGATAFSSGLADRKTIDELLSQL
ncbi:MAG: 1-phosphofructokinase [Ruminococcus sp.]|nr:1-phosphofructokinase [Ruminococcus sp.]